MLGLQPPHRLARSTGLAAALTFAVCAAGCGSSASGQGGLGAGGDGQGGLGAGGAGGGGGEAQPSMPFASGARLKVRVDDAGMGATTFLGIFDSALGIGCTLGRDLEGTLRCLPQAHRVVYGDPVCSKRFGLHRPGEPLVVAAREPTSGASCEEPRHRVHELGQAFALPQAFDLVGGQCVAVGVDAYSDYRLLGPEVDVEGFAEVDVEVEPALVARRFARTTDGFELLVDVLDEHGDACSPTRAAGGPVCATTAWSLWPQSGAYADASCAEALAYVAGPGSSGACAPHVAVELTWTSECEGPTLTPYALEGPVAPIYLYEGTCEPWEGPSAEQPFAYFHATELDPSALPALGELEVGQGPAVVRVLAHEGRPLEVSGALVDRESGQACERLRFVDGVRRCVPSAATTAGTWYADAECTEPLAYPPYLAPCSDALELFAVELSPATSLAESVRPVLGPYYGAVWRRTSELCEPVDFDLDLVETGDALPLERFATVVERVLE